MMNRSRFCFDGNAKSGPISILRLQKSCDQCARKRPKCNWAPNSSSEPRQIIWEAETLGFLAGLLAFCRTLGSLGPVGSLAFLGSSWPALLLARGRRFLSGRFSAAAAF